MKSATCWRSKCGSLSRQVSLNSLSVSKCRKYPDSISSIKSSSLFSKSKKQTLPVEGTAFLMTCIFTLSWILLLRFCLVSKRLSTFPFDNQRTMLFKSKLGSFFPTSVSPHQGVGHRLHLRFLPLIYHHNGTIVNSFGGMASLQRHGLDSLDYLFFVLKVVKMFTDHIKRKSFCTFPICEWFSILHCCSISRKASRIR